MPRFILCPFGSGGDVNPLIWLGKLLLARGHEVVVVTAPLFEKPVCNAGLEFHPVGTVEEYEAIAHDPRLWKPLKGTEVVFRAAAQMMEPFFKAIREEVSKGESGNVAIAAPFQLPAARLAREVLKVPLVTVHLQPIAMFSIYDRAIFMPGMEWLANLPPWGKRILYSLPNPADWVLSPTIKRLCRQYGVRPPNRFLQDWAHSPDGVLCLWPDWYAGPQADWPAKSVTAGFPLEDLRGLIPWPDGLREFLAAGEEPVLITAGTGNSQAKVFFEEGLKACNALGRRALLGTRYKEQLPACLPPWARQFDYLPFGELLPSVAAMIHHGGIGTLSQAFASGTPQVIVPLAHDQPDNAARMKKLGAGAVAAKPANMTEALRRALHDEGIHAACTDVAARCMKDDPAAVAVAMLEGVANSACEGKV